MFRLTIIFVAFKLLQCCIIYFVPKQFDISSEILYSKYAEDETALPAVLINFAQKHLVWDNVYYLHLAREGPQYEHEYVFSPGWWRVIRYMGTNLWGTNNFYVLLLSGIVVSNICQYLACIELYWYTKHVIKKVALLKHKSRLCYLTALAYIFSPGGVFLTTSYSENISSLATITGLFLRELALDYKVQITIKASVLYLLSGVVVSTSYRFRANCLLLGIFYLFDLYKFFQQKSSKQMILSIMGGLPLAYTFVDQAWYNYSQFCPERGDWCYNKVPLLFSYAQAKYWNNGFLSYWTCNNIPNFIIAFPIIFINIKSCICFLRVYPVQSFVPYILLNFMLLSSGIFFMNVQILNRILNFNPIFYWYLALTFEQATKPEAFVSKGGTFMCFIGKILNLITNTNLILTVTVSWILIQTALFGGFLPPA